MDDLDWLKTTTIFRAANEQEALNVIECLHEGGIESKLEQRINQDRHGFDGFDCTVDFYVVVKQISFHNTQYVRTIIEEEVTRTRLELAGLKAQSERMVQEGGAV